ncbi:negative regulator of sigma-X activity [Neobacillus kokaensis]|uniref:Anti-sigma-X factor RsiX n=1 Tax=Neobacillus kokaensis TaxID=2759023 RepID=A0ABQ3N2Q9_9BACI|nr:negative regulator of sigma-X activity [Neobacillus kokaensis]GHH98145.1 anti-sigma-X factor RsiX [Neobacillus kokaensis]
MKKSEWSDREIEELLRHMPKIQDHRDPRDIYQNLSLKKRKTFPWVLPSIAAAAALFLLIVLGPKLMDGGPKTQYSFDQSSNKKSVEQNIAMKKKDAAQKDYSISKAENYDRMSEGPLKTAIYEDEIGSGKVITYWVPDDQAQNLIPVSTIVQESQNESWLDLFNEHMSQVNEDAWGLSEYYPINAEFKYDEKNQILEVNVPADHQYGQGAANELMFLNIIKKDIASNSDLKKVKLFTDGKPGIEFGNTGIETELIIQPEKNHAYLLYYPNNNETPYLVPTIESFKTIKDAIAAMKKDDPTNGLRKSMLFELSEKDMTIQDNTLHVTMEKNAKMKNDQITLFSFEALLLTAKEFGLEKVMIKNAPIKQIGPFDLSIENKVPIAPNLRNIE